MARLNESISDGGWLTAERVQVYSLIALTAAIVVTIGGFVQADGLVRPDGQPIGTDFLNVYAAGLLALRGHAADAYDWARHAAVERELFGPATPYYGWHYPPMFLFAAAPLALLPYLAALAVWLGATLLAYLAALRPIVGHLRGWVMPALAFPAVFINAGHGQNGALSAALFGGGLALLPARPVVAGILLGLLCYKPQLAALIPLALAVAGQWRALAAMLATATALSVAALVLFGADTVFAFLTSTGATRTIVLEQGATGWHKIQSAFSAARNWGASVQQAYAAQAIVSAAAAGLVAIVWRSELPYRSKAAVLVAASLAATPYCLDYDLLVLAPALAFLAADASSRGVRPYEATLLAAVWAAPLLARMVMAATTVPLGAIATLVLLVFAAWPALRPVPARLPAA